MKEHLGKLSWRYEFLPDFSLLPTQTSSTVSGTADGLEPVGEPDPSWGFKQNLKWGNLPLCFYCSVTSHSPHKTTQIPCGVIAGTTAWFQWPVNGRQDCGPRSPLDKPPTACFLLIIIWFTCPCFRCPPRGVSEQSSVPQPVTEIRPGRRGGPMTRMRLCALAAGQMSFVGLLPHQPPRGLCRRLFAVALFSLPQVLFPQGVREGERDEEPPADGPTCCQANPSTLFWSWSGLVSRCLDWL